MSNNSRNLTVRFGADTSGFKKGTNEVRAELTELNSAMFQNRKQQKELNTELKNLEKQQKSLKTAMTGTTKPTEAQKKEFVELQKKIDATVLQMSQLKTEEQEIKGKISATTKELNEQSHAAEKNSVSMDKAAGTLKKAAALTGTAMAGLFTYTAKMASSADEINTLSKTTGLATDEIQKFLYASALVDVEMDVFADGMKELTNNMRSASEGSGDACKTFDTLKVSVTTSTGALRSNKDVFYECVDALSRMENTTQRDALAMTIFGESAQRLNPLIMGGTETLKQFGDELEREGLILDQMQLDKLNDFNNKIDSFKAKFQASTMTSADDAVDAFDELLDKSDEIVDLVATLITGFAKVTGFVVEHKEAVLALVVAYGAYKAAMSITSLISSVVAATKNYTTATQSATVAQEAMNTTAKAHPYILLASALVAVYTALGQTIYAASQTESNFSGMTGATNKLRKSIEDSTVAAESEVILLREKGERYEELRQKINKTAAEEKELLSIATDLENTYPNQIRLIGETAGEYKELGNQIEEAAKKMLKAAETEAAASALQEAYANKAQAEARKKALLKKIEDDSNVSSTVIDEDGSLKTRLNHIWEVSNIGDKAWFLNEEQNALVELTAEYNELNSEFNLSAELIADLEKQYGHLLSDTVLVSKSTHEATQSASELITNFKTLTEVTDLLISTENEFAESGKLSANTLDNIISKYPELEKCVSDYLNGLSDGKSVIEELNIAYKNDVANNKSALQAKLNTDAEYYNKLKNMNNSAINQLANQYGIDLNNYQDYSEAKLAIEKEFLSAKAKNWAKYYDAESSTYKITEKDLMQLKKELRYSGMSTKEINDYVQKYKDEYLATKDAVNAWNKFSSKLDADLTDYAKKYTPTLSTNTNTGGSQLSGSNSSGNSSSSSVKEHYSIYELANEALRKLADDRISELKRLNDAELSAADERIDAINKEIEARNKLKESNEVQKQIDYINAQLKYEKLDSFTRKELERQRDALLEQEEEKAWLESKQAEINAIEAEKDVINTKYSGLMSEIEKQRDYANSLFTDFDNGYKSTSTIVNNNSKAANITIVNTALTEAQVDKKIRDSLGGLIT